MVSPCICAARSLVVINNAASVAIATIVYVVLLFIPIILKKHNVVMIYLH